VCVQVCMWMWVHVCVVCANRLSVTPANMMRGWQRVYVCVCVWMWVHVCVVCAKWLSVTPANMMRGWQRVCVQVCVCECG